MERRPALRASDSDRDQVAERLRRAATEGRLFAEELEERLGALFASRTYGELDRLVADLPPEAAPRRRPSRALIARATAPIAIAFAVLLATAAAAAQQSAFQVHWQAARGTAAGAGHQTPHYFVSWPAMAALLLILPLCAAVGWYLLQPASVRRRRRALTR